MRLFWFVISAVLFWSAAHVLVDWEIYGEAPDASVMVQGVGAAFFALAVLAIRAARRS